MRRRIIYLVFALLIGLIMISGIIHSPKISGFSLAATLFYFVSFLGVALNVIAMAANGGKMPVKFFAGAENFPVSKDHKVLKSFDETVKFPSLCDIYPHYFKGKLISVSSIGDAVINIGLLLCWATLLLRLFF